MDLYHFREEYLRDGLHKSDLDACPIEQFKKWFNHATECEVVEPNAMVLATVDKQGNPLQRTVLLKAFSDNGFVFFSNFNSRKARDIEGNQNVCAIFPWVSLERQVIIQGLASKIDRADAEAYFASRPRESQLSAWVSHQSQPINSRDQLEAAFEEVKQGFEGRDVPLPDYWGGYRISPLAIEFWQGRKGRLHDRFLYEKQDNATWKIERLSP